MILILEVLNNGDYMENALEVYYQCLKQKYKDKEISSTLYSSLYNLIAYAERWLKNNAYFLCYPNGIDDKRELIIKSYLKMIKKMISRGKVEEFEKNVIFACSLNIDARIIPYFFNLLLFSNECIRLKKEEKSSFFIKKDNPYLYTIRDLLLRKEELFENKDERLLKDIYLAKKYLKEYNLECNIYIPYIILYCYANKLDENKYREMLDYAFINYNKLQNLYDIYLSYGHYEELHAFIFQRIVSNYNFDNNVIK